MRRRQNAAVPSGQAAASRLKPDLHAGCGCADPSCAMTHTDFAAALQAAVRDQDFSATPDVWQSGAPVGPHPSIDLAVVAFPPGRAPVWANVLFSREHPQGVVAHIGEQAGPLLNIRFDKDLRDKQLDSPLWLAETDWSQAELLPLTTAGSEPAARFVAPYPASLLKLMLAVGVALAVEEGACDWPEALRPMIVSSDNAATDQVVALLHRLGWLKPGASHRLNQRFAELGLPTLQLNNTQRHGGWRNVDGAGVGQIHMTAWDTVRLLWLLDADAPPAPWLPPGTALLQAPAREHLRSVLAAQQLDQVLSSGSLRGVPGWVPGAPDAPRFAHKTGNTNSYCSDAGIMAADSAGRGHALLAVITNLGRRHAPHADCATTWRLPALGQAVQALVDGL